MRALVIERSTARFGAARIASALGASATQAGPMHLGDIDPPAPPAAGWATVRPLLAGICGSDLATLSGRSSRWFEPMVSFPFVPGHEIVALDDSGRRVVVEAILGCEARALDPACPACSAGRANLCEHICAGHVSPGLQIGYCTDTGGGWSEQLVAHHSQLRAVPDSLSDEAAVLVEPMACAVHGALAAPAGDDMTAVVIGAGTLGLGVVAALSRLRPDVSTVIAVAKHPDQRSLALDLGASLVAEPAGLRRAVRRRTGSWMLDTGQLSGGASLVVDCVGSAGSLSDALAVAAPGATVVELGMPARIDADLAPLWQREVRLRGAYAYGPEPLAGGAHSFEVAMDLIGAASLERLVSAAYPLERFADAIDHATHAGARGATKVVFDLRRRARR